MLAAYPLARPRTGKSRPGLTSTHSPAADHGKRLGRQVVSETCVAALQEASTMLDRAAQALRDWRLHAKALTDYGEGKISLAEARRRWDETTKVGWAGADCFDKQAEAYKKAATRCTEAPSHAGSPRSAGVP
jgi:hypothetical protein